MNKNKMTKADLKTLLEGYKDAISDKSLKERISYTLKKYGESTKKTVLDLIEDIEASLTPAPLPVENSTKPTLKKSTGKKNTSKKPEPTEDSEDKSEEKPKKSAPKKSSGKSSKPKLITPTKVDGATDKSAPMSAIFPEKIEDENIGTMIAVPDKYHTIDALRKAVMDEGKTVVIAAYYPLPLIKKYGYSVIEATNKRVPKKGFAHDLDIQQAIYCCEGIKVVYALSDYTEAIFYYTEDMLTPIEVKDSATGDTVMTRFANGCEFELYEVVTDEE